MAFTRLKHIGIVTGKESGYCFWVNWLSNDNLPIDFEQILYRKTIEELRNDDMLEFVKKEVEAYRNRV
jgi:hypothetical protein